MTGVRVEVRRYVDDSFPGWVECWLTDAHGREWSFIEKVPVVSVEDLAARSDYPRPGVIACRVVERRPWAGVDELVVIDTAQPWHIESTTGECRFEVRSDQLDECLS